MSKSYYRTLPAIAEMVASDLEQVRRERLAHGQLANYTAE
jgi:hypothetical protein